jgi:hypothetical protein
MSMSTLGSRPIRVVLAQAFVAALVVAAGSPAFAQSSERAAATLVDAIHIVAAELGDVRNGAPAPEALPDMPASGSAAQLPVPAPLTRAAFDVQKPHRPGLLIPLYGTFAVLQGMDAHSTLDGVRKGTAVERNPLLEPFGDNTGAMLAIKAATTVGTIFLAEKMWRRHPVRAVVLMAAVNVAYAAIVATNYRR